MAFKHRINDAVRDYIFYKLCEKKRNPKAISKETGVSLATIYRIQKQGLVALKNMQKQQPGLRRPRKLTARDKRRLIRTLPILTQECSWNVVELQSKTFCIERFVEF